MAQKRKMEVSAGAIILRDFGGELKVALAQHQREKNWILPKGHVEPGETIEQAALREIYEEAGLDNVQLIKYLGTILRQTMKNGTFTEKTIHYYLGYAVGNSLKSNPTDKRFIEAGWFTPQEAIELLPRKEERAFFREHLAPLLQSEPFAASSNEAITASVVSESDADDDLAEEVDGNASDATTVEVVSHTHAVSETDDANIADQHHTFSFKNFINKITHSL
jgi:8-oxo-dGTP pyrophosphatase MutT (NUDIX family)